tara:strand:- start:12 stop:416 length:405 start_codon:yes stop_codon:yes gene_type:complete
MYFIIGEIEFAVKISIIDDNIEKMLILENYSLDNRKLGMPLMCKGPSCKFLFENKNKEVPYHIRIYLESKGNTTSPYNIYPNELKEGRNYFWANNGGFMITENNISLYINHDYLMNYKFINDPKTTKEYLKEYF